MPAAAPVEQADFVAESAPAALCVSCGETLSGSYCHACGERRLELDDASLARYLREAVDEIASLDSRAARSVRTLLFEPGRLTQEYLAGRRRPYLGPLKLYLAAFALTMLLFGAMPLWSAGEQAAVLEQRFFGPVVRAVAAERGVAPLAALELLTERMIGHAAWMMLVLPVFFAGFVRLLAPRGPWWFTGHLVFATHFAALGYTLDALLLPLRLAGFERVMEVASFGVMALMLAYLAVALRRVYGGSRAGTAVRAVLLMAGFGISQAMMNLLALGTALASLLWL
jgi:Protein of unknown function (DUF3667)